MQENYLSDAALAARFGVTRPTIWRWARDLDFPKPVKLTPGCSRWRASEVEAWAASRQPEPRGAAA